MDEPAFSRVLDAIYDAATSFDRWPAALERIGEVFGASYVGLIDRNLNTMEGRAIAVGIDLASQREYFDVWSTHDVLRQWTPAYRAGAVQTDRDILPRTELLRSDYYNGFMKPRDMHAVLRLHACRRTGLPENHQHDPPDFARGLRHKRRGKAANS